MTYSPPPTCRVPQTVKPSAGAQSPSCCGQSALCLHTYQRRSEGVGGEGRVGAGGKVTAKKASFKKCRSIL